MRIGAIIQARMNSKRFPGKTMYQIKGKPMIQYLLESLSQCSCLDRIVLATSVESSDNPLADFCRTFGIACHRGPLRDVVSRIIETIEIYQFDTFVRICGDSPLLDHRLVDKAVNLFKPGKYDLITNVLTRTFPKGQSVEVLDSEIFTTTYPLMRNESDREHVTPYFYGNKHKFSIKNFESDGDLGQVQLSVDTNEEVKKIELLIDSIEKSHWEYKFTDYVNRLREIERIK